MRVARCTLNIKLLLLLGRFGKFHLGWEMGKNEKLSTKQPSGLLLILFPDLFRLFSPFVPFQNKGLFAIKTHLLRESSLLILPAFSILTGGAPRCEEEGGKQLTLLTSVSEGENLEIFHKLLIHFKYRPVHLCIFIYLYFPLVLTAF